MRALLLATLSLALVACERADEPIDPLDPDRGPAETDPGAIGEPEGYAAYEAAAGLEPVGEQDVRGLVIFRQLDDAVHVLAEVGGLDEGHYHLYVLEARSCRELELEAETVVDLSEVHVADDGMGRTERRIENLSLEGPDGILGRAVVVAADDAIPLACGVVSPGVH